DPGGARGLARRTERRLPPRRGRCGLPARVGPRHPCPRSPQRRTARKRRHPGPLRGLPHARAAAAVLRAGLLPLRGGVRRAAAAVGRGAEGGAVVGGLSPRRPDVSGLRHISAAASMRGSDSVAAGAIRTAAARWIVWHWGASEPPCSSAGLSPRSTPPPCGPRPCPTESPAPER